MTLRALMTNHAFEPPDGLKGLRTFLRAAGAADVPPVVRELVRLRVSQINGCSPGVHISTSALVRAGTSTERIGAVSGWRDASCFDAAERAALELAETVARLAGCSAEAVDDELWNRAAVGGELWERVAEHFDERRAAALIVLIGATMADHREAAAPTEMT